MSDELLLSTLMKLIQDRDHKAFETFYELTVNQLTIFLKSQTDLEVDDLLSQTYITIWEKAHLYDSDKGQVKSWMLQIAKNIMISEHRRQKPVSDIDEAGNIIIDEDQNPSHEAEVNLTSESVFKVLGKLKDDYKNVIIFRFLEGYSIQETAEIMNISEGNVRIIQHRALKELGNMMGR